MPTYRFTSGGPHPKSFELFWAKARKRPAVRCIDENWDYDDECWAGDLSDEVRACRTLEEAAAFLGLAGDASDSAPDCHPALP